MQLGDGSSIDFWGDLWVGNSCLKESFPRIFALATKKSGLVNEFGCWEDGKWVWDIKLRRRVFDWEKQVWEEFLRAINSVKMGLIPVDSLRWVPSSSGVYSPKDFILLTYNKAANPDKLWKLVWAGFLPPKVETLIWQIMWGRVPVRVELCKRKIAGVNTQICPLCLSYPESVDHLFFTCGVSWRMWSKFCSIWGIHSALPGSAKSVIISWAGMAPSLFIKEFWMLAFGAIAWSIWLCRNDIIFNAKSLDAEQLFDLILLRIGLWTKSKWPNMLDNVADFVRCPYETILLGPPVCCGNRVKPKEMGSDRLKFFVDAALDNAYECAGIGGVLKGIDGSLLFSFAKSVGNFDITTAEILAIREAMLVFSTSEWATNPVIFLSDCANAVTWIMSPNLAPAVFKELVNECAQLRRLKKWDIRYIPREENVEADECAKRGRIS